MAFRLYLIYAVMIFSAGINGVFVSNLNEACLWCICQGTTGCDMSYGCTNGHCGPFYISRFYWIDADKPVLPHDDPEREGAFQDCTFDYNCAKLTVERYMVRYGRDCNGDHVTTCEDYALIHMNGGNICNTSLAGSEYYTRFTGCLQAQSVLINKGHLQVVCDVFGRTVGLRKHFMASTVRDMMIDGEMRPKRLAKHFENLII